MKYSTMVKLKRNQEIRALREAHPELSLEEIGKMHGISAQRVWAILKNNKSWQVKEG